MMIMEYKNILGVIFKIVAVRLAKQNVNWIIRTLPKVVSATSKIKQNKTSIHYKNFLEYLVRKNT